MPKFVVITSRGLLEPLAEELQELGIRSAKPRPDAVSIECSWADVYLIHLRSRLASRVLLPVSDFRAYNEEDLYYGILRKTNFSTYMGLKQTFRVEAHVREHPKLRDQRFVAMKVKDAVVDQFRAKFGERPDVGDEENVDLRIVVRIVGSEVSVAIDLTGSPLSNRGYRIGAGEAPLRENVAAGILRLAKWSSEQVLVDPFCGSGTLLIEAALAQAGSTSLKRKRSYAFERLANFQPDAFTKINQPVTRKAAPAKPRLFGFDHDSYVLEQARQNAKAAGVENWISFQKKDVRDLVAPSETGLIITNPPYGERMLDVKKAQELMADFSQTLKHSFKGWEAWILSGNKEASAGLRLKAKRRIPLYNGPIECRLLHYPLT